MAGQVVPLLANNKRRRADHREIPKKRPRSSLEDGSQTGYTNASDIFGLQVHELLGNLEVEADANVQKVTELLKQLKEGIEGLSPQKPLLVRSILRGKIQVLISTG